MSTTKFNGRENLTKYAFWLGPLRPTDKENQVTMYKEYCVRCIPTLLLRNGKDPNRYQIKKEDPDRYQREKQDPDQKGLDQQHC